MKKVCEYFVFQLNTTTDSFLSHLNKCDDL